MVSFQIPYFNAYFTSHVDGWMKEIACIQKGQQRNIQKQRSPGSIYTGIIKNTYRSTFGSYIKELHVLIQKYWQLISTKQLWSVLNIVSSKSRTVQYRVPRGPGQYRNVLYRDVQVPRCLGFIRLIWYTLFTVNDISFPYTTLVCLIDSRVYGTWSPIFII